MRYLLLCTTVALSVGCYDRGKPITQLPQTVVGVNPGSTEPRLAFVAPDGFEWNEQHRIWYNENLRASVTLAHAPGIEFQSVVDDFVADRMLASSMELLIKEVREIDGRPTLLIHANRLKGNYPQQACTVAYATDTGCAQLTAMYPTDMNPNIKTAMEQALLTSHYGLPD